MTLRSVPTSEWTPNGMAVSLASFGRGCFELDSVDLARYDRAGGRRNHLVDVCQGADDRRTARCARELARGDDLRQHRSRRELRPVPLEYHVRMCPPDEPLLRRSEPDERARCVRRHDQDVRVDIAREQAARVVLVDDRFDADQLLPGAIHRGNAAAAGANHHTSLIEQPPDRTILEDPL